MKAIAQCQFIDRAEYGSRVEEFREIVGETAKRFRAKVMPRGGNKKARDKRWLEWISGVEFDDTSWERIRRIKDHTISGLTTGGSTEFHLAIYYRFHSLLDIPEYPIPKRTVLFL